MHQVSKAFNNLIVLFDCHTALGSKMDFVVVIYPLLVRDPNELVDEAPDPSFRTHRIASPLGSSSYK